MTEKKTKGSYRALAAFQMTTLIYDRTVAFCERFIDRKSRLVDQMVQAARSGRQNIAEGSRTGLVNPQSAHRLITVARASLEELLLDFEDFLRQRSLAQWDRSEPEAIQVLAIWRNHAQLPEAVQAEEREQWRHLDEIHASWYARWFSPEVSAVTQANTLICLINQANYRLDNLLRSKERTPAESTAESSPLCPICGAPMVVRTRKKGERQGSQFLGCQRYPDCTGTRPLRKDAQF